MTAHRRDDKDQLSRLRGWRVYRDRSQALGDFLPRQFKQEVAKPYKQLGKLSDAWVQLVPQSLRDHTKLDGFSRGTLRVSVDSASHRYELDRLLRAGLERQLISIVGGQLRKVKLSQSTGNASWESGPGTRKPGAGEGDELSDVLDDQSP